MANFDKNLKRMLPAFSGAGSAAKSLRQDATWADSASSFAELTDVALAVKDSDQNILDGHTDDVTDLAFPVTSGHRYQFRFVCGIQSPAGLGSLSMEVTTPAVSVLAVKQL